MKQIKITFLEGENPNLMITITVNLMLKIMIIKIYEWIAKIRTLQQTCVVIKTIIIEIIKILIMTKITINNSNL